MKVYRPDINTDAYSREWLENRAAAIRRKLTGGTKAQRQNPAASAELAAINHALRHRPTEAQPVPRPGFIVRPPEPAPPSRGVRGYSDVVAGINQDRQTNPLPKYHQYA